MDPTIKWELKNEGLDRKVQPFCFMESGMKFLFYTVDAAYCDFLRIADPCVPYTMDRKSKRPFVGIVFSVNGFNYYAPLTSPKPKHRNMKNQIDFLKIRNGELGAINFNNMIPVPKACLRKVEMEISSSDPPAEIRYKNLLSNQLSWCNSNREIILRQASNLYAVITRGNVWGRLAKRCCAFNIDERRCLLYEKNIARSDMREKSHDRGMWL